MSSFAIVIAGASGAGKTTVADRLIAELGIFDVSRSATTRGVRKDARKDEYIYLSEAEFSRMVESSEILEHTVYDGNMYGTPRSELDRIVASGKYPLLILDMNGVASLKRARLDYPVYSIYLYSSLASIERRLYERYLAKDATVDGLLAFQSRRLANIDDYLYIADNSEVIDFFIKNEDIDVCINELERLIEAIKHGTVSSYSAKNAEICAIMRAEAKEFKKRL